MTFLLIQMNLKRQGESSIKQVSWEEKSKSLLLITKRSSLPCKSTTKKTCQTLSATSQRNRKSPVRKRWPGELSTEQLSCHRTDQRTTSQRTKNRKRLSPSTKTAPWSERRSPSENESSERSSFCQTAPERKSKKSSLSKKNRQTRNQGLITSTSLVERSIAFTCLDLPRRDETKSNRSRKSSRLGLSRSQTAKRKSWTNRRPSIRWRSLRKKKSQRPWKTSRTTKVW